jgi:hypothetical protein
MTGGGFHNLSADVTNGKSEGGFGFILDLDYAYFFDEQWGLKTGVGIKTFQGSSILNTMTTEPAIDSDGDTYEHRVYFKDWKETESAVMLSIPLEALYKLKINRTNKMLLSLGADFSFPLLVSYQTKSGSMETRGYYSQWNVELYNMPEHGFGTVTTKFKGDNNLYPSVALSGELGNLYRWTKKTDFYYGLYFSYSLNSVLQPDNKSIYQKSGLYNGLYSSQQTSSVYPITFGFKLGLNWSVGE